MQRLSNVIVVMTLAALMLPVFVRSANAADITNRRLNMSAATPSTTTVHTFSFALPSTDDVGSIVMEYCIENPFVGLPCTSPPNMDVSGSTLTNQSGETGFTIDAATTVNRMVLTRAPVAVTPQQVSYELSGVTNPDTIATYYVRLSSHASTDGTGPHIDDGGIAFAIESGVNIESYVPPFLTFCVGETVASDCSSASGNFLSFGELTTDGPATVTSQMAMATNGQYGVSVAVTGTTMTSGNNIIPGLTASASSQAGTGQFGLNLRANTNPDVGTNPFGPGVVSPTFRYNQPNIFSFNDGDIVCSSNNATDYRTFTASYLVNIDEDQPLGVYATTLSYTAFASF